MQVRFGYMNPIRFYRSAELPEWVNNWPNWTNVKARTQYIEGVYPGEFFQDWVINEEMSLQLRITTAGTENLTLYKKNSDTSYTAYATITPTDITPAGWTSEKINRYNYTFTEAGTYYFESTTAGILTEKFIVHSDQVMKRRLVKIEYINTENDYGMVFYDYTTLRFTGKIFLTGQLLPDAPGNEISGYNTDRGNFQKLRSTPVPHAILNISDMHYSLVELINLIFSCDNLTINGMTYQTPAGQEVQRLEKSDLIDISLKLQQTNYNYING